MSFEFDATIYNCKVDGKWDSVMSVVCIYSNNTSISPLQDSKGSILFDQILETHLVSRCAKLIEASPKWLAEKWVSINNWLMGSKAHNASDIFICKLLWKLHFLFHMPLCVS